MPIHLPEVEDSVLDLLGQCTIPYIAPQAIELPKQGFSSYTYMQARSLLLKYGATCRDRSSRFYFTYPARWALDGLMALDIPTRSQHLAPTSHDMLPSFLMFAWAWDITDGSTILEPSAGAGTLIHALHSYHPGRSFHWTAVETNPEMASCIPDHTSISIYQTDFAKWSPTKSPLRYDFVLAHPSFTPDYATHLRRASSMLRNEGALVSIVPAYLFAPRTPDEEWIIDQIMVSGGALPVPHRLSSTPDLPLYFVSWRAH